MSKVIGIVGSRKYPDDRPIKYFVGRLPKDTTVVSGGARGLDRWAIKYAKHYGLNTIVHKPDKKKYGILAAFFVRNRLIVDATDIISAFRDGCSPGTRPSVTYPLNWGKFVSWIKKFEK